MAKTMENTAVIKGVAKHLGFKTKLAMLKTRLDRNRLGELLVGKGRITGNQLDEALAEQKQSGMAIGEILVHHGYLSNTELKLSLWQQVAYRSMASILAFVLGLAATGIHPAQATSAFLRTTPNMARSFPEDSQNGGARFIPAAINPDEVERTSPSARIESYPLLFGTSEVRSSDTSDFTKFNDVAQRLTDAMQAQTPAVHKWQHDISALRGDSLEDMAKGVNAIVNKVQYIEDNKNYGASDKWATPEQFFARGGDCEDYAIAKYASLKALGVPEERLRIAIVEDTWKNIPHAVLTVYTDHGILVLDNQNKDVISGDTGSRYHPIYSINQQGWWRHVS